MRSLASVFKLSITLTIIVLLATLLKGKFFVNPVEAQGSIPTDQNFKVAFIGDSGAGGNFQSVLDLIKAEGADMVMHQGDFAYNGPGSWTSSYSGWSGKIQKTLGDSFPYLGSDGNHDSWSAYAPFFKYKMSRMGLDPNMISTSHSNYAPVYRGLKMVFNKQGGDQNFTLNSLQNDNHIWKVCSWHHNRNDFQAGGKGNSVSLQTYKNCLDFGAIIATGHEHSYSRTCALSDPGSWSSSNNYGATCQNNSVMQVGPKRSFIFVAGTGGAGLRDYHASEHDDDAWWSTIYTSNRYCKNTCTKVNCNYSSSGVCQDKSRDISSFSYKFGALFITFYVDGNPNKARAYFKNINGNIIDEFEIIASGTPITITPTPSGCQPGTVPGDANGDCKVDGFDYVIWWQNFGKNVGGGPSQGDFNRDGTVDGFDYVLWWQNFGIGV